MIKKGIRKNENYNTVLTLLAWRADVTIGGGTCFSMDSLRGRGVSKGGISKQSNIHVFTWRVFRVWE